MMAVVQVHHMLPHIVVAAVVVPVEQELPQLVSTVGTGGAGVQVLIAGPPTTTGVGATGPSSPYGQWFAGGGGGGANVGRDLHQWWRWST